MSEMKILRELFEACMSMRRTAIIDDDFPERRHKVDSALTRAEMVLNSDLSLGEFREANVARCLKWHSEGIQSWSASDWLTAITGELGELASLIKMQNRERDGLVGNKFSPTIKQISDEIADVFTYLDLLASYYNIELSEAVITKFNETSNRVGLPDRL